MGESAKVTIRVPDDHRALLELVARIEGTTVTELIRQAVDGMIEQFKADPLWQERRAEVRAIDARLHDRLVK